MALTRCLATVDLARADGENAALGCWRAVLILIVFSGKQETTRDGTGQIPLRCV